MSSVGTRGPAAPALEEVAPDAVELIRAFRESGGASFHHLSVGEAREAYHASCSSNGVLPEDLPVVEDLACPVPGGEITLRRYAHGAAEGGRPVVLFVHGGGWVIGSLDTHDRICRRLATASGLDVLAVDYRLAPEFPFPTPLQDSGAALAFLRDRAGDFGWDPQRVVVVGDSAGATLATALATNPECAVPATSIVGQALLYPVTDLSTESEAYARVEAGLPLTADSMRWFRDHYLPAGTDPRDPRISPGLQDPAALRRRGVPDTFLVTVGLDPLSDEGIAYAGLLSRAGGAVEHHHLPRHAHGLFTSAGRIATGARMLDRLGAWVASTAGGTGPEADG